MSDNQLQKHLDKGRYGTPLVNPDEQHKYLGTFRERCYLSMTIAEMDDLANQQNFLLELAKHPAASILLNGQMPGHLQRTYIQLLSDQQRQFTIISDDVEHDPDDFGLLLTAKEAVNEGEIDIEKKYPPQKEVQPQKVEKGFWKRLFH
ncbi:MAG: YueI family protein [Enterococcus sp.]